MDNMLGAVSNWLRRRSDAQRLRRDDARRLLALNPTTAYYDAQRLAARARFSGDGKNFIHWAHVAAEVARIGNSPMNIEVVKAIVDEEERLATRRE